MYFISTEVEMQSYLHRLPKKPAQVPIRSVVARRKEWKQSSNATGSSGSGSSKDSPAGQQNLSRTPPLDTAKRPVKRPPFNYNPLHDLESVHWLAHYMLFAGQIIDTGTEEPVTDVHRAAHHALAKSLFGNLAFRTNIMRPGSMTEELEKFKVHPRVVEIAKLLDEARAYITNGFSEAEATLEGPIPFSAGSPVYDGMLNRLEAVVELLADQDVSISFDHSSRKVMRDALIMKGGKPGTSPTLEGHEVSRSSKKSRTSQRDTPVLPSRATGDTRSAQGQRTSQRTRTAERSNTTPSN